MLSFLLGGLMMASVTAILKGEKHKRKKLKRENKKLKKRTNKLVDIVLENEERK